MVPELSLEWILERHKLVDGFSLPPFHVVSGSSFKSLNANPRALGANECSVLITGILTEDSGDYLKVIIFASINV